VRERIQKHRIATQILAQLTDTGVHLGSGRTVQLSAVEDLAPKLELVADRNHNSEEPTVWEMTNLNKSATLRSAQ